MNDKQYQNSKYKIKLKNKNKIVLNRNIKFEKNKDSHLFTILISLFIRNIKEEHFYYFKHLFVQHHISFETFEFENILVIMKFLIYFYSMKRDIYFISYLSKDANKRTKWQHWLSY